MSRAIDAASCTQTYQGFESQCVSYLKAYERIVFVWLPRRHVTYRSERTLAGDPQDKTTSP